MGTFAYKTLAPVVTFERDRKKKKTHLFERVPHGKRNPQ
jgi:hypothetical protein